MQKNKNMQKAIHFLNKRDRNINENVVIATFDVVGPYRNISHSFRLEAVRYYQLKYKEDVYWRFIITFTLGSSNFILKNNTHEFEHKYFFQRQGTTMETVFVSYYALGYHEIKFYDIIGTNYNLGIWQYLMEN